MLETRMFDAHLCPKTLESSAAPLMAQPESWPASRHRSERGAGDRNPRKQVDQVREQERNLEPQRSVGCNCYRYCTVASVI